MKFHLDLNEMSLKYQLLFYIYYCEFILNLFEKYR
jgi:hypothetical protein